MRIINEQVQVKDLKVGDLVWGLPTGLGIASVARHEVETSEPLPFTSAPQRAFGLRVTLMVTDGADVPEEWLRESSCYRVTIDKKGA